MNTKILLLFRLLALIGTIGATSLYITKGMGQKGVVTGILYTIENSSAVVDGQIVYEGDTIYDVEVIGIEKCAVEFEKNDNYWKQGVGERPNPLWEDSDNPHN